jgi:hypothetical protein
MTQVTTQVFETYQTLNRLYSTLKHGKQPTAVEYESLNASLIILRDLNDGIANIESGSFDVINRKELALQQRAAAWLLGWAALTRMVVSFSRQSSNEGFRKHLILLTEPSALGLLLAIYRQLKDADSGTPEPLQHRLKNRTNIVGFSYTERVSLEDGSTDWYIPLSVEIVGRNDDDPGGHHDILSLWGFVNLQLDTWYSSAPERQLQECRTRKLVEADGNLGLSPLADWLSTLNNAVDLDPLGQTDSLKTPLGKIVKFLQFRERYASEVELRALCDDFRTTRINGGAQIPEALTPLVEAATPTANKEQLYDAAIWLRYVLLLSFDRERSVITDDTATNNLEKTWKKFGLGQPYAPVIGQSTERKASSCAPFLRWNAAPYNGHVVALLADLIDATYNYLKTERAIQNLEEVRFQAASKVDLNITGKDYAKKLKSPLTQLNGIFKERVQSYFPPKQDVAPVGSYQPSDWADALKTLSASEAGIAFHTSCTASEQRRLMDDLATIAQEIKSTEAKYGLIRQAYEQASTLNVDLQQITGTLQSLGGLTALSNWNVYRLPSMSFDDYQRDFVAAINKLEDTVDAEVVKEQLRKTFTIKRLDLQQDYLSLLAAKLGREVAQRAIKISQIYQRIHELDVQIEALGASISRLESDAWKNEKEKAGVQLAYATRMRDLAAARVEALIEASKEAAELAKTAEEELGAMAQQLKAAAQNTEDNNSSAGIFGIVKLVVSVVGAALAPFTAGASIAVATLVNKGIDIYEQMSKMKWGSLTQTIANLEELGPALADGITFAVDNFGSAKVKDDFAKTSAYLKSTRDKLQGVIEDLRKRGIDLKDVTANSIIKAVQEFKKPDDILNFAAAIANGYTITVANTKVKLDFRGKKISFTNDRLRQDLLDLFAAGHIIINDATARAEGLTNLAILSDEELRQKLHDAFKGAVAQLPPELLEKLNLTVLGAKEKAQITLDRIKDNIAKELKSEELRLFSQLLAAGCLFVKEGEVIVAVEPAPLSEAEKFKLRLNNYKSRIQTETVAKFASFWTKRKEELIGKSQELSTQGDAEGLRAFANSLADEITRPDGFQARLQEIKAMLDDANDQLEDKTTETEIANYEAKANALFAQASGMRMQQADVRVDQADLKLKAAMEIYLNTLTEEERAGVLVQAELRRIESGELGLIQAYEKCLAVGFNPLSITSDFNNYEALSIRRVLANFVDLKRPMDGSAVGDAASALVGMIQWASLLGVVDPKKAPASLYFKVVKALTVNTQSEEAGKILVDIQKDVELGIKALNLGSNIVDGDATHPIPFDKIFWVDRPDLTDERRKDLAPLIQAVREELLTRVNDKYKNQVVGMLRVIVDSPGAPVKDESDIKLTRPAKDKMYYVDVDSINVIAAKGPDLSFLVVPPLKSYSHPNALTSSAAEVHDPRTVKLSWELVLSEKQFADSLGKIIRTRRFTGALGVWEIFILASVDSLEQRVNAVKKLMTDKFQIDTVPMIFIQIPIPN